VLKGPQGEVREAVITALELTPPEQLHYVVHYNKGHGRIERRAYWWLEVDDALQAYLAETYGWTHVRWCGRVRRSRRLLHESSTHEEETFWLFQAPATWDPVTPEQLSDWVRAHWHVENCLFWVLDVTYGEDRSHARRIASPLHILRALAINIIRLRGFRFVPDGRRVAAARDDRGLAWLCDS